MTKNTLKPLSQYDHQMQDDWLKEECLLKQACDSGKFFQWL